MFDVCTLPVPKSSSPPLHTLHSLSIIHATSMTKRKWATKEQEAYLTSRKPNFLKYQAESNLTEGFYAPLYEEFREQWPEEYVPTQKEIEANGGNMQAAEEAREEVVANVSLFYTMSTQGTYLE